MQSRNWEAKAKSYLREIRDYEEKRDRAFDILGFDLSWNDTSREGSTSNFRAPTSLGKKEQAFWAQLCDLVDPRCKDADTQQSGLDRFVLGATSTFNAGPLQVLSDRPGVVYENGLILDAPTKERCSLGYNYLGHLTTSRERNTWDPKIVKEALEANGPFLMLEPRFANEVTRTLFEQSDTVESQFDSMFFTGKGSTTAAVRLNFAELFGPTAVVSWKQRQFELDAARPIAELVSFGFSFGTSREAGWINQAKTQRKLMTEAQKNVSYEFHREGQEKFISPAPHKFFNITSCKVMDSGTLREAQESAPVEIGERARREGFEVIQAADTYFVRRLHMLSGSERGKSVLASVGISEGRIKAMEEEFASRDLSQIEWRGKNWGSLAQCIREEGPIKYAFNAKLLDSPALLFRAHLHELTHRATNKADYLSAFQSALLLQADEELLAPILRA